MQDGDDGWTWQKALFRGFGAALLAAAVFLVNPSISMAEPRFSFQAPVDIPVKSATMEMKVCF